MLSFVVLASAVLSQSRCTPENTEIFKEWRQLTPAERTQYVEAVGCLANAKSTMKSDFHHPIEGFEDIRGQHPRPSSRLDDFTYSRIRVQLAAWTFIDHPSYLPWHRVYLRLFDTALRNECHYKGRLPYWDLSINGVQTPEIWQYFNLVRNPYFGTLKSTIPKEHDVRRFALSPRSPALFSAEQIKLMMQQPDYDSFRKVLEKSHTVFLGGSQGDISDIKFAPNDPLFYLLQRNVDRLWYQWQQAHPLIANSYQASQGNSPVSPTDTMQFYGMHNAVVYKVPFIQRVVLWMGLCALSMPKHQFLNKHPLVLFRYDAQSSLQPNKIFKVCNRQMQRINI